MRPLRFRRSRRAGAVASARSSAARSPWPQCLTAESRFAAVCYGSQIGRRTRRPVTSGAPPPLAIMTAKAPGGPQDASSGSGRSKRGPARLSSNAAGRTRIGRGDGLNGGRIAVCYGLRGFANQDEQEPASGRADAHPRESAAHRGAVSAAWFQRGPLRLPRRVGHALQQTRPSVRLATRGVKGQRRAPFRSRRPPRNASTFCQRRRLLASPFPQGLNRTATSRFLEDAVDMSQVGIRDVRPLDDSEHFLIGRPIHDGKGR
jgi:hypothetical protein